LKWCVIDIDDIFIFIIIDNIETKQVSVIEQEESSPRASTRCSRCRRCRCGNAEANSV
jgi:hypothetical protein